MGIDPFEYIPRNGGILKSTQSYTQFKTQTAFGLPKPKAVCIRENVTAILYLWHKCDLKPS